MPVDQHGVELSGSPAAIERYDRAVHELLHFRAGVIDEARSAVQEDPRFPMGNALRAYLRLLTSEADDAAAARDWFVPYRASLQADRLLPRERAHLEAVGAWLDGDMLGAGRILAELTQAQPRDAVALAVGHQIDFFTGNAAMLRDRVGAALPAWSDADPHLGPLLGMHAFGLEESGQYDRSEETGLRAVELDGKDVWGIHAVVHTYEMQARFGDGIRYFDARRDDWTSGNFFNVHNWWHYALYELEAGAVDRALAIYDASLHNAESEGVALELLDAAALLWRLYLDGVDQTERWSVLAEAWAPKTDPPFYSFNDMHAVMSFVGCGRLAAAGRLIADRERYVADPHPGVTNHAMTARVGLPVCKAILAFGAGRYGEAVDLLHPIRGRVNEFGGSHAQRDAVQRTLLEAALRAGRHDLARSLVDERIHVRPCSPYNWLVRSRLADALGDRAAAAAAAGRAGELAEAGGVSPGR
jgi:tetratricopeptide (TPR) repeat protein